MERRSILSKERMHDGGRQSVVSVRRGGAARCAWQCFHGGVKTLTVSDSQRRAYGAIRKYLLIILDFRRQLLPSSVILIIV